MSKDTTKDIISSTRERKCKSEKEENSHRGEKTLRFFLQTMIV
jgi:hypothetical protein